MSDFKKKQMYRLEVTYREPENPEDENYEVQHFDSFLEAEKAAQILEAGEDPWYGDDVICVDVNPDPVEVEILHHDHSDESRDWDLIPEGRVWDPHRYWPRKRQRHFVGMFQLQENRKASPGPFIFPYASTSLLPAALCRNIPLCHLG